MPRPPKKGIDYAGWSVTMFDGDKKIDKLLDAQGWRGFGVYFFLCQTAYKLNGYYLEWDYDDCASTARKMGGGVGSATVEETVKLCLQVGLFDNGLFDKWGVLTSRGIQKRFWVAAGERGVVSLYRELWLLPQEEANGLNKHAEFVHLSGRNSVMTPHNSVMTPRNSPIKESKGKERKEEKKNKRKDFVPPSLDEVRAYAKERSSIVDPDFFYEFFSSSEPPWVDSNGKPVLAWKQKFVTWEKMNKDRMPGTATNREKGRQTAKTSDEYKGDDFFDA